jgi:hypothetical protein
LRIACTARVVFSALALDDVGIGNVVLGGHAEVLQARRRQADADHFDVGDDRRAALQDSGQTGLHRLGVEGGQAVELEVGVGVDHAAHQWPLLGGVVVRPDLGVDDGEGVVLDGAAGGGELFGNRVGGMGWPWSCQESWKSECVDGHNHDRVHAVVPVIVNRGMAAAGRPVARVAVVVQVLGLGGSRYLQPSHSSMPPAGRHRRRPCRRAGRRCPCRSRSGCRARRRPAGIAAAGARPAP